MTKILNSRQKDFNIVIVGTGGQGLITLLKILAEAAMLRGFSFKTSELHGLSQRGGSVECHLRFGKEIHSPLVMAGKADLLLLWNKMKLCEPATMAQKKKRHFW